MNDKYAFFWSYGMVWALKLETRVLKKLSLYISEDEKESYVRRVRCGSHPDKIGIRVAMSPQKECLIYWDMAKGSEFDKFDIDKDAMTF